MIHSSARSQMCSCYTNTFQTPSRGRGLATQSPFLLCWKATKTAVRHGGFSAHVERLMGDYGSVARALAEQGPSCWTGSRLRQHGPAPPATLLAAWWAVSWGRKVKADTDTTKSLGLRKLPVCSDCACGNLEKMERVGGSVQNWLRTFFFSGRINPVAFCGSCGGVELCL